MSDNLLSKRLKFTKSYILEIEYGPDTKNCTTGPFAY